MNGASEGEAKASLGRLTESKMLCGAILGLCWWDWFGVLLRLIPCGLGMRSRWEEPMLGMSGRCCCGWGG